MQLIKPDININFIDKRKFAFILSLLMILVSIGSLIVNNGPKLGIDFTGGTQIQIKFDSKVDIKNIKDGLKKLNIENISVQEFGEQNNHEYLVKIESGIAKGNDFSEKLIKSLNESTGNLPDIRRIEMVGPTVGKDLREKAFYAMFYTLLFITIYISGRFELKWMLSGVMAGSLLTALYFISKFNVSVPGLIITALFVTVILFWFLELRYAMGAIIALIHDITITVGVFSLLDLEFSLSIIAALLTIIGYSLNDTIIVFDRIRENLSQFKKKELSENINRSINETISRTILTSITTLSVVVILYLFGGGIIHDFAFAMIVGIMIGTYSSIFVASPILLAWQKKSE